MHPATSNHERRSLLIGNGNDSIVKSCSNIYFSFFYNYFYLVFLYHNLCYFFVVAVFITFTASSFFNAPTVFLFPLLVRAFDLVRCPRRGKLCACRTPL